MEKNVISILQKFKFEVVSIFLLQNTFSRVNSDCVSKKLEFYKNNILLSYFSMSVQGLKVLSSEMDPAKLGSFDMPSLKRERRGGFLENSAHPP